jgi:hypothetical protein
MLFTWLKNHLRELFIVLLAMLFLLYSPSLIRLHDPTAGELDGSVFQILAYAGLQFFAVLLGFWVALSAFFPTINRYADYKFKADWAALPAVHRAWLMIAVLFLLTVLASVCLIASHAIG